MAHVMIDEQYFTFKTIVIGIFCGNSKPSNVSVYLSDFVEDLKELLANSVIGGKFYEIYIYAFM